MAARPAEAEEPAGESDLRERLERLERGLLAMRGALLEMHHDPIRPLRLRRMLDEAFGDDSGA